MLKLPLWRVNYVVLLLKCDARCAIYVGFHARSSAHNHESVDRNVFQLNSNAIYCHHMGVVPLLIACADIIGSLSNASEAIH